MFLVVVNDDVVVAVVVVVVVVFVVAADAAAASFVAVSNFVWFNIMKIKKNVQIKSNYCLAVD